MREARAALGAGEFAAAAQALADGDGAGTADWLELRSQAAYGSGDYEGAVTAWEQLHTLHRSAGETVPAARAAVMTAMFLVIDAGMLSTVRGWVRRAQRLLEGRDDTPVHALIAAVLTYERFFSGDLVAASRLAADAIRLGETFGVMPAVAIGRTATARIAVLGGDIDGGLDQLDEVAALLMSGEIDPLTVGMMLCELVCAAQGLMRADLAREWTDAMARWSVTGAVGGIRGRCRVHQAELLRLSGPCDAAEREALQACDELRPWMRREYGWPLVELAMTRLRRGDLAGAEETFVAAAEHSWPVQPGLALLRLEQGDPDRAAREIAAAIARPVEAPSKEMPPFGDLRLVSLLDAQSEIAAVRADEPALSAAAERLARIAEGYHSPTIGAMADRAAARAAVCAGDPTAALASGRSAVAAFVELEMPFESAGARIVVADALRLQGDPDAAVAELRASRSEYLRYGARLRAAALDARLVHPTPVATAASAAAGHRGTFRREGSGWRVALGGQDGQVKELKGLHYLHRLLADPGREFHVLDLVAVESGTLRPSGVAASGVPMLDQAAKDAYRRRLADIDDDIDDATQMNDIGRRERAEADRAYLVNELARAVGIGGRTRRSGDASERARTAVARTMRYALDELARQVPAAATHLRASLRTGTYCSYQPDPLTAVSWDVESETDSPTHTPSGR